MESLAEVISSMDLCKRILGMGTEALKNKKIKNVEHVEITEKIEVECKICNDTEIVYNSQTGIASQCSCSEVKRCRRILKSSGIGDAFSNKKLSNFETNEMGSVVVNAKIMANKYITLFDSIRNSTENSIAFLGQSGSGKTHLSISIANKLLADGTGVLYMPYVEAIQELKRNTNNDEAYTKLVNRYKSVSILYIDDLFKSDEITRADKNIMFEILNHRYLKKLPIIVSSELFIEDLIEIDEAIAGRIVEMCRNYIVQIKGKNYNYRLRGII